MREVRPLLHRPRLFDRVRCQEPAHELIGEGDEVEMPVDAFACSSTASTITAMAPILSAPSTL
jgi:hypothetical protein